MANIQLDKETDLFKAIESIVRHHVSGAERLVSFQGIESARTEYDPNGAVVGYDITFKARIFLSDVTQNVRISKRRADQALDLLKRIAGSRAEDNAPPTTRVRVDPSKKNAPPNVRLLRAHCAGCADGSSPHEFWCDHAPWRQHVRR